MFILYVFFTPIRFCSASGLVGRPLDAHAWWMRMRGFSAYLMRSANHVTAPRGLSLVNYPMSGLTASSSHRVVLFPAVY